jgi:membrane-bound metal-dependent hydrolase YbcI (DUF457 family)
VTTIGHSLTGLSLAALTLPSGQSRRWYVVTTVIFVVFANLADFPLPGWGHSAYHISHSVFVTALLASLMTLLLLWPTFNDRVGARVIAAWSIAWLSHLPLDSMYAHGQGIAIFWPFSAAHLAMPVPWFETVSLPAKSPQNLRVFAIETMVFGAVLIACLGLRRARSRREI